MPGFRTGHPRCAVRRAVTATFTAGEHVVTFDTTEFDDTGMFDGSGTFTVDRAGLFQLQAAVTLGTVATTFPAYAQWSVNAVRNKDLQPQTSTGKMIMSWVELVELDAGDVLQLHARRHSTASSTLVGGETFASIVRIGPVRWV